MDLKQKVKTILLTIGAAILIGFGGYLIYFIVNDTLPKPPENRIGNNLFIAKNLIDIENLGKTNDMLSCRNSYYNTWYSIQEDYRNFFLDKNGFYGKHTQENENQHQTFWKKLNFAYAERFITLADDYFEQPVWNNNTLVSEIIVEIRKTGFIERNTPLWNSLHDYEKNISCYKQMQNYINWANKLSFDSFPAYDMERIKQGKAELENCTCKKNSNKVAELNNSYDKMRKKAENYLEAKIEQYDKDFTEQRNNSYTFWYQDEAYRKYDEVKKEVDQWNTLFYNNEKLKTKLQDHKRRIDCQYY
ncbi:MAG: hypothetical protein LBU83_08435 [Bacteroidales bacterium]|jgi:hypothetical protein|nr:hypothetical protein [Bacteroidales bacterium]